MKKAALGKSGSDALLQRARPRPVAIAFAKHAVLFPLIFCPPMVWAVVEQAWPLASTLLVAALVGLILWRLVHRQPLPRDLRQIEAIAVLVFLFTATPVLSVPAFMVLGMSPLDALFEGMSAITTTGLSLAADTSDWPYAAHLLRSWMQWCGGLAMATAVLAMLIGPGATARKMGKVSIDEGDRLSSTRNRARQLLGAYAGLTALFIFAISLSAASLQDGLLFALSAISTGGFGFMPDSVASFSVLTQTLVILASICGAVSLLTIALACRGDWRDAWGLGSVQRVFLWSAGVVATLLLCIYVTGAGDPYVHVWNLLSAVSTAGFSIGDMPTEPLLLVFFVLVMMVGGDVGSTAGGLKLSRLTTLLRAGRHATRDPRMPDTAVAPLREKGKPVRADQLIALMAVLLFYSLSVLVVWCLFLGYGYPPLPALFDTVSAFSTVGLSTGVIAPDNPAVLKCATILAMLLGRLEFIAVILMVLPRTWYMPPQRS